MLKSVEFMSLKAVKLLVPSADVAVISIRNLSSVRDLPTFNGFLDVLPLDMLDVYVQAYGTSKKKKCPKAPVT